LGWAAQQAMKVWWYRVIDRLIGEQSGAWIWQENDRIDRWYKWMPNGEAMSQAKHKASQTCAIHHTQLLLAAKRHFPW
jgi:hypothetical protein